MIENFRTGSTHHDCVGDTDICPDQGCKRCQGADYDNLVRGRITRDDGTETQILCGEYIILDTDKIARAYGL